MPKKPGASPTPVTTPESSRLNAEVKAVLAIATDARRAVNRRLNQVSRKIIYPIDAEPRPRKVAS
jgi:hypothetical protein